MARRAIKYRDRADKWANRDHQEESKAWRAKSDAIIGKMGGLKDSEKSDVLLQQQLTQLAAIAANTAKAGKVRP